MWRVASPGRGLVRLARGTSLAGFCATLSLTAHVVAGGRWHMAPGMLVLSLLLAAVCVAAADRRRGFAGILTVVGLSQVVFHLLAGGGGHHHGAGSGGGSGAGMVLAHAVAAVLVSAGLAHGERLLWSLYALLGVRRAAVLFRPLPVRRPSARPAGPGRIVPARSAFPRAGAVWRGPPVLSK